MGLSEQIEAYLRELLPPRKGLIAEMEHYAEEHGVPIMEPEGIEALLQILRLQKAGRILEVGAAIGYSAIRMAEALPDSLIVTMERDEERILQAKANISKAGLGERILLIEGDALEAGEAAAEHGPYDAVFIDAAKGQYRRFFELFSPLLRKDGIIVTDNVLFKGLVAVPEEDIESKRTRSLVKKIKAYNAWLSVHPDYDTVILPIGDGVAISKYKGAQQAR